MFHNKIEDKPIFQTFASIEGHICSRKINQQIYVWRVSSLWNLTRDAELVDIDVDEFDLNKDFWFQDQVKPTVRRIAAHCKRIIDADLNYPIILAPDSTILDGAHRLAKAKLSNLTTLKAVRLSYLPPPDYVLDD